MAKTLTTMELAVLAKSGGGTSIDNVADLISSFVDGSDDMSDAEFAALRDEVMALIPSARFSQREAELWARADSLGLAEVSAERRAFYAA